MDRPPLEVADLVRAAGAGFLQRSRPWIRWKHVKVLLAIARCRTAALGGYFGLLANRRRSTLLPLCFHRLGSAPPPQPEPSTARDGQDLRLCP